MTDQAVGTDAATVPGMVFGTYEQALALVGVVGPRVPADQPVDEGLAHGFCAIVEDGNAAYWEGRDLLGGPIAPPAMMNTWTLPTVWRPGRVGQPRQALSATVPLPGGSFLNSLQEVEMPRALRYGERLSFTEELVAVSPEKSLGIGRGHFVTTRTTVYGEDDDVVGRITNTVFRFTPGKDSHE